MALLVGGCSLTSRPLPTLPPGEFSVMTARMKGEIVLAPDTGCLYIRDLGGNLHWALWPNGYRLILAPVRIMAGDREVVREGQVVDFTGGYAPAPKEPCRIEDDWWVVGDVAHAVPASPP